ncbi:USG-1 protein [Arsenophonus endosymbiont of Aleurodicus dispersus]|uniref:aspartate-semialdehyde dehydrogenase n=1 Tax=Arsenophonus endosymbiont of Aleurodicus dispersus TaxID=235559 RepID=UPI000EAD53C4|nr:aspartate-semialdehyde dehydrogenase [Arsenophonus endosymbiont of Aleurodicus dispersus]VAY02319.1 USG-1 protein [Arsenophonus endosymbiont of Aleurodicus dispersus]
MTKVWNIALLGATGSVGEAVLCLLQERQFPFGELFLLDSENSAGESIRFNGKQYIVIDAQLFDWTQVQLAFFVADKEAAASYAEKAAQDGCIVIDSSALFALEQDIPLVVPSINPHVLANYRNRNIIAIADSYVSQLLVAVKPLMNVADINRLILTNLFSVSMHGKSAVDELSIQSARLLNGLPVDNKCFIKQLAFNLLPLLSDDEGSVPQERSLVDQVHKILQNDRLSIVVSFLQAPVFYGNAQVVHVETLRPITVEEAWQEIAQFDDIHQFYQDDFPTQVTDASSNDRLSIGCMHHNYGAPEILQFWSVADNTRFGGARMLIETAERLVQEQYY